MKDRFIKNILLIIVSTCCVACNYCAPIVLNIDNQTNDTIMAKCFLKGSIFDKFASNGLVCLPQSITLFYSDEYHESINNGCDYPLLTKYFVGVYTSSGEKLRKEFWELDNWNCNGSFKQGWKMTFVITEEDLE